ncbi:helix-turn-helix domain-containing protein, partial [Bacillus sp. RHFS18]|nr:helix-turn-helix domain-containing protein [Bacillus sp. RHFS18]
MESFGKQLRTLREKRHLTVNQLATYSGVSAAGISRIENGKRGVPKPA